MSERPTVFVGSSKEGLSAAQALQINLDHLAEVVTWNQGVFGLMSGGLESLFSALDSFDFAVFVLTPDDLTESRDVKSASPRDNVLLELGMFLGRIGRERTFAVFDRSAQLKMPSDLAGITLASFEPPNAGTWESAMGAASTQISNHIKRLGSRSSALKRDIASPNHSDLRLSEPAVMKLPAASSDSPPARDLPKYIIKSAQDYAAARNEIETQARSLLAQIILKVAHSAEAPSLSDLDAMSLSELTQVAQHYGKDPGPMLNINFLRHTVPKDDAKPWQLTKAQRDIDDAQAVLLNLQKIATS
jgi:hypothetical protein